MSQHFLLSAKARTLSPAKVARMSDQEARETFAQIRFAENGGEPFCPSCGSVAVYEYKSRPIFKCQECTKQFSITSGTIFASRKLAFMEYLLAIAIFVNGSKGHSALQLSRDFDVQYKTACVLAHKFREAMMAEQTDATVKFEVGSDGAYFGGYVKPQNKKKDRVDRRLAENQSGKRTAVVVMRKRRGQSLPNLLEREGDNVPTIRQRVERGSAIYADEANVWDPLHAVYNTHRINHRVAYMDEGVCTNMAECVFSCLRRAEIGMHYLITGKYLAPMPAGWHGGRITAESRTGTSSRRW